MTEYVYLKGILKWCRPTAPDPWGKYKTVLYPDADSLEKIRDLQTTKGQVGGIMNVLKKDDDGYNITISRPVEINIKGRKTALPPVEVFDGSKKAADGSFAPLRDTNIGNGSSGVVKCELRTYKRPTGGQGRSLRLSSIRVDELIPFSGKEDYNEREKEAAEGMEKQSAEQFW